MELTFEKFNNKWTAEFEISADANLHIEKIAAGPIKLYQRTTGGGYDLINDVKNVSGKVDDIDLSALVYPKTIKIVSEVEPTYAAITTDGEVTEIKSQSKVVEVTSNGTTAVTPDAGYSYLSGVNVKVNVPQSGGGSTIEYLDVGGMEQMYRNVIVVKCAYISRIEIEGQPIIFVANTNSELTADTTKVMIDTDAVVTLNVTTGETASVGETLVLIEEQLGMTIPRITKEEFYNTTA